MNNRTTTPSEITEETACTLDKDQKARPSRMRALVRRLTGRSKARKSDVQQYPHRTLEHLVAQYASDDRPEPENKEAAR